MPQKKISKTPRPRHGWTIHPKTRLKPSEKSCPRKTAKKAEKHWVDELFD